MRKFLFYVTVIPPILEVISKGIIKICDLFKGGDLNEKKND